MRRPLVGLAVALAIGGGVAIGAAVTQFAGGAGSPAPSASGLFAGGSPPLPPSAGASPSPSPSLRPSPSPSPTPVPSATPVPSPSPVPAPLTGVLVDRKSALQHPIAVMVDDHGAARPQAGFSGASVVWHAPAEGGIPRYMMVFAEGLPESVGPVRSARHYFIAWAAEWRAAYVHSGGSPLALATLRTHGRGQYVYNADEFRWGGRFLWRVRDRSSPHNVYTDGRNLRAMARAVGARNPSKVPEPIWRFAPDAAYVERPEGGTIQFSYPQNRITYRYDRASNTYLRSVTGEAKQADVATGERVAPKNVVVMYVRFAPLRDGTNKQRLEANVVGKGVAWIATNGRTIKGTWRKDAITKPTRFFGPGGEAVTLTAGQTFIQVVPTGTKLTVRDGSLPLPTPRQPGVPIPA